MTNSLNVKTVFNSMSPEKQAITQYAINVALTGEDTQKLNIKPVYDSMTSDEKLVLSYLGFHALKENSQLAHAGVKGMKWGVRKSAKSTTSSKSTPKATKPQKEKAKDLSDTELRARINRLQMEQQYKQMTNSQKSAGQKFVTDVLQTAAKTAATQLATKAITSAASTAFSQAAASAPAGSASASFYGSMASNGKKK